VNAGGSALINAAQNSICRTASAQATQRIAVRWKSRPRVGGSKAPDTANSAAANSRSSDGFPVSRRRRESSEICGLTISNSFL
jgi:hypothetical protein